MIEKLHTGELYLPMDDSVISEQLDCLEKLYDFNLMQNNGAEIVELTEISGSVYKFDIETDDNYIYFFNQEGNNNYLNRIKAQNNVNEEKEMFGVYETADIPVVEEETEE